jgi:hypothetical protein
MYEHPLRLCCLGLFCPLALSLFPTGTFMGQFSVKPSTGVGCRLSTPKDSW